MPEWAITLLSVAASATVSGVIGYIIKRSLDAYFNKKDVENEEKEKKLKAAEELIEKKRQEDLETLMNKVVDAYTSPIGEKLTQLEAKLGKVADGTLDTLRDRILSSYYKCLEKGYRTQYDIDNVEHMHKDYLNLDGNTFVADCMRKFKDIPTEQEWRIEQEKIARKVTAKKRTTKKKLVE